MTVFKAHYVTMHTSKFHSSWLSFTILISITSVDSACAVIEKVPVGGAGSTSQVKWNHTW